METIRNKDLRTIIPPVLCMKTLHTQYMQGAVAKSINIIKERAITPRNTRFDRQIAGFV